MIKALICGGRDYKPTEEHYLRIMKLLVINNIEEIVSGGAKGADAFGEAIAKLHGGEATVLKADWNKHGKSAGPIRNRLMLDYLDKKIDIVIALPGGSGTQDMMDISRKKGLPVYEI